MPTKIGWNQCCCQHEAERKWKNIGSPKHHSINWAFSKRLSQVAVSQPLPRTDVYKGTHSERDFFVCIFFKRKGGGLFLFMLLLEGSSFRLPHPTKTEYNKIQIKCSVIIIKSNCSTGNNKYLAKNSLNICLIKIWWKKKVTHKNKTSVPVYKRVSENEWRSLKFIFDTLEMPILEKIPSSAVPLPAPKPRMVRVQSWKNLILPSLTRFWQQLGS